MLDWRREVRSRLPDGPADRVEELALHLEEKEGELRAGGMAAEAAEAILFAELDESMPVLRVALPAPPPRLVPGVPRRKLLADLGHELRHAARALVKNKALTAVTLTSLALGIGANATLFQILAALELRPLPVRAPDELVQVRPDNSVDQVPGSGRTQGDVTGPLWQQLRRGQQAFSSMVAFAPATINLTPGGEVRQVPTLFVSGNFFQTLGVPPAYGRVLGSEDGRQDACVAVVSDAFFRRELGGDPAALGRKLPRPHGHAIEIVGVTPPWFRGVNVGVPFDLAVPLCAYGGQKNMDRGDHWWLAVMGRLRPGWSRARASAYLRAIWPAILTATLPASFPPADAARYLGLHLAAFPGATGYSPLRETYARGLVFLLGVAGLVLLLACANLANLLLARGSARERELAVRLALGASRGRLLRQQLVESALIAALGAALGLALPTRSPVSWSA